MIRISLILALWDRIYKDYINRMMITFQKSYFLLLLDKNLRFFNHSVNVITLSQAQAQYDHTRSRINIGSDGTLARAPLWMGLKRGHPIYFLGPLFI